MHNLSGSRFSKAKSALISISSFLVCLLSTITSAQTSTSWNSDAAQNNPIIVKADNQWYQESITDSDDNTFIVWQDRGTISAYVQKISSQGNFEWSPDGIKVAASSGQTECQLVSDGNGGVIVTWTQGGSTSDIKAQRISFDGALLWGSEGVVVCQQPYAQQKPQIQSLSTGGAIIVWQDGRISGNNDIYAQRLDGDGTAVWTTKVCGSIGSQELPQIASNGNDGAFVCWLDKRSGTKVYGTHILANGNVSPSWIADGKLLSGSFSTCAQVTCTSDGQGGMIVVWQTTSTTTDDIYGQRTDGAGSFLWGANPRGICLASGDQKDPRLLLNGLGGAIVVWSGASSTSGDIFFRQVNPNGTLVGLTDNALTDVSGSQLAPVMCSDGNGGAIVAWLDNRNPSTKQDVYAQKINSDGLVAWPVGGVPVCNSTEEQVYCRIAPAVSGGAIISWWDFRTSAETLYDIYASRINSDGTLGPPPPSSSGPLAPGDLVVTDVGSSLDLSWTDNASNETGYRIMRGVNGAEAVEVADLPADTTAYSDTDINNCSVYSYTVVAYNGEGEASSAPAEHDNADAPTLSVYGDNPVTVPYGRSYYDAGASAVDGCGNYLSVTAAGIDTVDPNVIGTYTINYTTSLGGESYNASRTVNVVKADQTITFAVPEQKTYGDGPFTFTATSSSGLPIDFTHTGPATLTGNTLAITGAGTVTITAAQPGNQNYNAAPSSQRTVTIKKANASISVIGYNGTYDGLPHTATGTARGIETEPADLTSLLTINGTYIEIPGGTCTWTFAGNDNYHPASGSVAITIRPVQPLSPAPPVRP